MNRPTLAYFTDRGYDVRTNGPRGYVFVRIDAADERLDLLVTDHHGVTLYTEGFAAAGLGRKMFDACAEAARLEVQRPDEVHPTPSGHATPAPASTTCEILTAYREPCSNPARYEQTINGRTTHGCGVHRTRWADATPLAEVAR